MPSPLDSDHINLGGFRLGDFLSLFYNNHLSSHNWQGLKFLKTSQIHSNLSNPISTGPTQETVSNQQTQAVGLCWEEKAEEGNS